MRVVSLFVLLTFGGTPIVSAVCDLSCEQHARRDVVTAASSSCHGHEQGGTGPVLTGTAGEVCHDRAAGIIAIRPASVHVTAYPAVLQLPPARSSGVQGRASAIDDTRFRSPDVFLVTIPLRI